MRTKAKDVDTKIRECEIKNEQMKREVKTRKKFAFSMKESDTQIDLNHFALYVEMHYFTIEFKKDIFKK